MHSKPSVTPESPISRPLAWTEHAGREWLLSLLTESLASVPKVGDVSREPHRENEQFDAIVHLELGGNPVVLLVEIKKSAYPRDVREALERMMDFPKSQPAYANAIPLLASSTLSAGARALLKEKNVGYFDAGGSLYLPARHAYVFIDKPPVPEKTRGEPNLFRGRTTRVVHALLDKPDAWYRASELADVINVAVSTVSRSFIELERMELVETRGKGPKKERHLTKPAALLDAWAEIVRAEPAPPSRRYFVSGALGHVQLVNEIAHMLENANIEHALTGEAAAQRYNPFLTSVPLARFRVENIEQAEKTLTARKVRRVDEGANLVLIDTPERDEFLLKQSVDGISVVSPIQAYIDLQQLPGRAKEASQHLREERLGYLK
jgi:hypothetical protein